MNIKILDLNHRKGEPLPFRTTLDPSEIKNRHQEIRALTPVEATGEAVLAGGLYYVKGEMDATANFVCARCLKPFEQHLHVPFQETFVPEEDAATIDENDDVHVITGEEIELDSLLQEDFLLAVPTFPLCDEDCKGLCPSCGVNLNENTCQCKTERIDPRLAGLADFFKE